MGVTVPHTRCSALARMRRQAQGEGTTVRDCREPRLHETSCTCSSSLDVAAEPGDAVGVSQSCPPAQGA